MKESIFGVIVLAVFLSAATASEPAPDQGLAEFDKIMQANPPRKIAAPAAAVIPLMAGRTAGSEIWETQAGARSVRQVTQAALYPVLPAPGTANGTAVVIAPGGAFMALSIDSEGFDVANYLAARGITCFVLKYRLDPTPEDTGDFLKHISNKFRKARPRMTRGDIIDTPAAKLAQEDGLAAVRWVRAHAGEYGIAAARIGFMGFSAGGMTTMNVATSYDSASRPDFIGVIYGAGPERPVRADAPPAFIAMAADDPLLGYASIPIFEDWRAAGKSAELHVYAGGSHGFGMRKTGTSADHWIEDYHVWLKSSKFVP